MNENGQRLLPLCSYHSVCITNSLFLTKTCHKVCARHTRSLFLTKTCHKVCARHTRSLFLTKTCHKVCARHTRSHHWHQLDVMRLIYTERCALAVFTVQTATQATPWCAARSGYDQRNYITRINTGNTSNPELSKHFVDSIEHSFKYSADQSA